MAVAGVEGLRDGGEGFGRGGLVDAEAELGDGVAAGHGESGVDI